MNVTVIGDMQMIAESLPHLRLMITETMYYYAQIGEEDRIRTGRIRWLERVPGRLPVERGSREQGRRLAATLRRGLRPAGQ